MAEPPELPAAITSRATPGPDGTGPWIALKVPETEADGEVQAGDTVLADIDRAGLEDAGPYLIIIEWRDGSVSTVFAYLAGPLFTKKGAVRKRLVAPRLSYALEGDRMGVSWWPVRCRKRVFALPRTVRPESDLERMAAAGG